LLYDLKGARAFHQGEVASADSVGVQAVDDVTLVMELEEPTGHFLSLLTRCGMPVPRHVVEVHREAWTRIDHLVTSGPFMLPSWEAGRSMVLTRNPAYRGRSRGNAQQVELALVPSSAWAESLGLYERDELDVVSISAFPSQELEAARQRHAGDYVTSPRFETCLVGFLTSKPPFDDVRVRRALALALDREFFADEVLGGHVSPGNGGMVPPGMPGHSAGIGLPHDPDQARHLLAAAGYPGGRGFPLVDGVLTGPSAARVGRFLEDQWRDKLGVTAACRVVKTDAANDLISQGPPLLAEMTWVASYPDPDDFLGVGASHAQWFSQWQSETFDRLVDEARRTTNQKDRMELYRRADRVLIEEVGGIPIFYGRSHLLVKPWIRNYFGSQISKFFWKEVIIEPH
jgi:oligopeptide transport system substrate-binding protein